MNLILLQAKDWVERSEDAGSAEGIPDSTPPNTSGDVPSAQGDGPASASVSASAPSATHTPLQPAVTGVVIVSDARRTTHMRTVLRAAVGDVLKVGEANGLIGTGTLESITTSHTDGDGAEASEASASTSAYRLRVRLSHLPPPPSPVTVVLALPEKTVFVQILHQLTVLGVKRLYIIHADAVPASWWGSHALQRDALADTLTLGLEQTIDTTVPKVHLRQDTERFLATELPQLLATSRGLILAQQPGERVDLDPCHPTSDPVTLVVGPSANFTDKEQETFMSLGCKPVSFGPRALHVTAAVHALVGRMTLW
eukprot:m.212532 g.212532  ORF g.212532 m.212532 type:complete len:312 (+) comp26155_c0_seq1:210-1145(+)